MPANPPAPLKTKLRWFYPTPSRLLVILLAVEGILLLSERFKWFPFNEHKGWTVLIAVAAVGLFLLFMLIWFIVSFIVRLRFQFSIRSLLLLTLAVALPFSWLAVEMKWAKEQKETVEALRKLGGKVGYDSMRHSSGVISFRATPSGPEWLRKLLGDDFLGNVTVVSFEKAKVNNDDLVHIEGMSTLQYLILEHNPITDSGLEHIESLGQLQMLDLSLTHVTGSGMRHLEKLKTLHTVSLSWTKITDHDLQFLNGLHQLKELYLTSTQV